MRGSVFGAKIPLLDSNEHISRLQEQGHDLGFMPTTRSLQTQREILEAGVIAGLDVISQSPILAHVTLAFLTDVFERVSNLLLDVLFDHPDGIDFFRSRPKDEISQFVQIVLPRVLKSQSIPIVTSTCPDYEPRSYKLNDGAGLFAERTLRSVTKLRSFFENRGIEIGVVMHLADGDAADPLALTASGESRETFLVKTQKTVSSIQDLLEQKGMQDYVTVVPMSTIFDNGVDGYKTLHEQSCNRISSLYAHGDKRVVATVKNLLTERKRLGDFDDIPSEDEQRALVISELAGYDAYGKRMAGKTLIVSPGAKSVVPAYNFDNKGMLNPIIYVYDKREGRETSMY